MIKTLLTKHFKTRFHNMTCHLNQQSTPKQDFITWLVISISKTLQNKISQHDLSFESIEHSKTRSYNMTWYLKQHNTSKQDFTTWLVIWINKTLQNKISQHVLSFESTKHFKTRFHNMICHLKNFMRYFVENFPDLRKYIDITAVFKEGDATDKSNYSPISTLSNF